MSTRLLQLASMLATRIVSIGGIFGVGVITARLLGPEDRGLYFFAVSLAQIAAQISNFGLHASNTYVVAQTPGLLPRLAINSLYVALIATPLISLGVVSIAVFPDWYGWTASSGQPVGGEVYAAVLIAPSLVTFLFLSNLAIGIDRIQLFNGLTVFASLSAVSAAAIVATVGGATRDYLFAAALAPLISSLLAGGLLLRRQHVSPRFDVSLFRTGAPLALRAYVVTLLSFLIIRVGAVTLQLRASPVELGQFSIASQLFDGLMVLPGTIGLLLFPDLVRQKPEDRWPMLWRTFWRVSALMFVLTVVTGLLLPWIIPFFFGDAYSASITIAISLLPAVMIFSFITVVSQFLSSEGYPWSQIVAWSVGLIAQTILSYGLASAYGGLGVSVALTLSSLIVFMILLKGAFDLKRRTTAQAK